MSCTPFISATLAITVSAVAPFGNPDLYHPDPHHIWNRLHSIVSWSQRFGSHPAVRCTVAVGAARVTIAIE